jgi:PIN domain nuclease of toxin-antitoxin system
VLADEPIGSDAARRLADPRNVVLLSAVVVWEVAIKRALGKLDAPDGFADTLLEGGAQPLPITGDHAAAVEGLPAHHGDPFDRLLVAQAQLGGTILISSDAALARYDVRIAW